MSENKLLRVVNQNLYLDPEIAQPLGERVFMNEQDYENRVVDRFYELFTSYSSQDLRKDPSVIELLNRNGLLKKVYLKMAESHRYLNIAIEHIDSEILVKCLKHNRTLVELYLKLILGETPKPNNNFSQAEIEKYSKFLDFAKAVFKSVRFYLELAKIGKQDILYLIHYTFEAAQQDPDSKFDLSDYPYDKQKYWEIVSQKSSIQEKITSIPEKYKSKEIYLNLILRTGSPKDDFREIPKKFIDAEISEVAFGRDHWVFRFIPEEFITQFMCDIYWISSSYSKLELLNHIPKKFHTLSMIEELLFEPSKEDIIKKWDIPFYTFAWAELIEKNGLDKMLRYISCFLLQKTLKSLTFTENEQFSFDDDVFSSFETIIKTLDRAGVNLDIMGLLFGGVSEEGGVVRTRSAAIEDIAKLLLEKKCFCDMVWEQGRYFILNTNCYNEEEYCNIKSFKMKEDDTYLFFDPINVRFFTDYDENNLVCKSLNHVLTTLYAAEIQQNNIENIIKRVSQILQPILKLKERSL